jgi:hypothetical protein
MNKFKKCLYKQPLIWFVFFCISQISPQSYNFFLIYANFLLFFFAFYTFYHLREAFCVI